MISHDSAEEESGTSEAELALYERLAELKGSNRERKTQLRRYLEDLVEQRRIRQVFEEFDG